ncbi:MAG: hypothetical protein SOX70_00520 [Peptoniphilaceae bacterium]|nr:transposon-encoded TnpW family protein [Peptoniphilaceae bacterium]MDY4195727.1 hypothetical protein [Peptoniphilaceae bacterium]
MLNITKTQEQHTPITQETERKVLAGGTPTRKVGNTIYTVKVFFNPESEMTTEEKVKRVILNEIKKDL